MSEPGDLEGLVGTFLERAGPDSGDISFWEASDSHTGMSTAQEQGYTPGEVVGAFWLADLAAVENEGRRVTDPKYVPYKLPKIGRVFSEEIEEAVKSHEDVDVSGTGPRGGRRHNYKRYVADSQDAGGSRAQKWYLEAVAEVAPRFEPIDATAIETCGLWLSRRSETDHSFVQLAENTAPVYQKREETRIQGDTELEVDPEKTGDVDTPDETVRLSTYRLPSHWDLDHGRAPSTEFYNAVEDYVEQEHGVVDPRELNDPEPEIIHRGIIE